ncbi:MAG: NHL repeat domain [Geobacteraceae bacterium]|nr:MAG: NHL repeat domain [Geobacteraceae bacterium]
MREVKHPIDRQVTMKSMKMVGLSVKSAAVALTFAFLTGCATAPQVKERYFWPPLPDTPRIEWLGAYSGEGDLKTKGALAALLGEEFSKRLGFPVYVTSDGAGKIYVSDHVLRGVMVFDLAQKEAHALGGEKTAGMFQLPSGVALDGDGNIYVGDSPKKTITVFDRSENAKAVFDLTKDVKSIASIAIDRNRKRLYVPDVQGHKIAVYDLAGKLLRTIGPQRGGGDGEFNFPTSVALDKDGNLVVCDSMNARIQRLSPEGEFLGKFGKRGDGIGEFNIIKAAAVDSEGHIYVTDGKGHKVTIFNEKGETLMQFGGAFAQQAGTTVAPGGFLLPQGIFIDGNDTIYVVDQMNYRVQVFQYMNDKYWKEHPVPGQQPPQEAVVPAKAPAK